MTTAKQFARNRLLQAIATGKWQNGQGKSGHSRKDELHNRKGSRGCKHGPGLNHHP